VGFQVDKRGIQEHRASLYLQLNRVKEAEEAYRQLLDVNPDNYSGYFAATMKVYRNVLGFHHMENTIALSRWKSLCRYMMISARSIHVLLLQSEFH
jgi:tetratricopeptide (TPR) repeat protein